MKKKREQTQLFDPVDFQLQGPEDRLTEDARHNLDNSFGHPGAAAGSPFVPSNGTEDTEFSFIWCDRCHRDDPEFDVFCPILERVALGKETKEWIHTGGKACCTEFTYRLP